MGTSSISPAGATRDLGLAGVLAAVFLAVVLVFFWDRPGPDIVPTWLAAKAFANGAGIYPPAGDVFTTAMPPDWTALAAEAGYTGPVFAYIYPPLWAALLAPLTPFVGLFAFHNAVLFLNALSVLGILGLARRIAAPDVPLAPYLLVGLLILSLSPIGVLGVIQNQPQIFVGFLSLLAVERGRAGRPLTAGAVLGLATALKIAPLLLLPALLMGGNARRTLAGFVAAGGALGLLSLALAGWPMHRLYLDVLSTISGSVIVAGSSYTLDALAAQIWFAQDLTAVTLQTASGLDYDWLVLAKPAVWRAVSGVAMILAAILPAIALRRGAGPFLWPAAMILIGVTGSIGWCFYYIPPMAFLPALMARAGGLRGAALALLLALPATYFGLSLMSLVRVLTYGSQAMAVVTLIATGLVFAALARSPETPLRPLAA